ncbi:phosphatidylserine decarboxylase [Diplocloster hominis]|uniref:phosphatidylserine decarboxylase n=1 Tax=Diplocloster hominis TaxID=3079010 RepID=UPI0031BB4E9C
MKYFDREGRLTEKSSGQDRLLKALYTHAAGRLLLKPLIRPAVSKAGGWLLNSRVSALLVKPFVRWNRIDLSQCERKTFQSFNDFFTRRLQVAARPIAEGEQVLISPCDGKLSVWPIKDDRSFQIKNTWYTLNELLRSGSLAKRYEGGFACVFRLTVDDYHRYCYMADGLKSANRKIPGMFHTVNPIANDCYPIYKENTREYCVLKTKDFGSLLIMEVGALMVGRITNHQPRKTFVSKGQEKGRFEFGGSTIVVLLPAGRVRPDQDLIDNTRAGGETIVKMGERIGVADTSNTDHKRS